MKHLFTFFKGNQKIETQTVAYSFNFFLPTGILIFLSLIKEYDLSAEIGIIISINYLLTQVFSSNARSLIISKNYSIKIINTTFTFRALISIFVFVISLLFIFNFQFVNKILLINITLIIILQWIIELILLSHEFKKKNNFFINYIFISSIIIGLYFSCIFFDRNMSVNFLFIYNLFLIIIIFNYVFCDLKKINKLREILNLFVSSLKNYSFFSSLFIQLTNLIWRVLLLIFCGKTLAGIFFSSFAIGSLPSTIFNNSFGPTMHKKKITMTYLFKNLIIVYFLTSICLFFYSFYLNIKFAYNEYNFHLLAISISMIGSFFMIKGTSDRQYMIQNTRNKNLIFRLDIFYSLCLIIIIPILFYFGGKKLLILSFFTASLFSYFVYSIFCKKLIENR